MAKPCENFFQVEDNGGSLKKAEKLYVNFS